MSAAEALLVHATVVVVGESGVLIEGAAGAGKTSLALALLADARLQRSFGRLVGDDRVALTPAHGRLLAAPHRAIAGLIEHRGFGIVRVAHEPACVIGLVVQLVACEADLTARHPDHAPTICRAGTEVPLLTLLSVQGARENSQKVFTRLAMI